MTWAERVVAADPFLSRNAYDLVQLIARYFSTNALSQCSFYDSEAACLLGITAGQLRDARYELMRKNFLAEITFPGQKSRYALKPGLHRAVGNDGA
jgi:hypothetical protein